MILIQYIMLPLVHHSFICFILSVHAYTHSLILTYLLTAYQVPITMPGTGHPIVKKRDTPLLHGAYSLPWCQAKQWMNHGIPKQSTQILHCLLSQIISRMFLTCPKIILLWPTVPHVPWFGSVWYLWFHFSPIIFPFKSYFPKYSFWFPFGNIGLDSPITCPWFGQPQLVHPSCSNFLFAI